MKQCHVCKTTYEDDSLSFCLSDGTPLVLTQGEQETVVRKIGPGGSPVDVPIGDETWVRPAKRPGPAHGSNALLKFVAAGVVLVFLIIGGVGMVGALIYFGTDRQQTGRTDPSPSPLPSVSPSPDLEKERLRGEIANIQRQLDEQKRNSELRDVNAEDEPVGAETATVNSPGDGFLALRSLPDSERGVRLAKIPHGYKLELIDCEGVRKTIGGRSGRWCLVEYSGTVGWVFDAWLDH